jgi:hypothetical protein
MGGEMIVMMAVVVVSMMLLLQAPPTPFRLVVSHVENDGKN